MLVRHGSTGGAISVSRTIAIMPDDTAALPAWLAALEAQAPDLVAPFAELAAGRPLAVRRAIRARAGEGSAARILRQHAAIAEAYAGHLDELPAAAFGVPGGEAEWTAAQALGHALDARARLVTAASLAAQGRFPADAPTVVAGIPGPSDASREDLRRRLERSQRLVTRAARAIAGHEADPCPLEHPLVGRLRCGEWLLFAGVHDLMHLEQLEGLAASPGASARPSAARTGSPAVPVGPSPAPARSSAAPALPETDRP